MSLVTCPTPTTPAEELALKPFALQQKVEACRVLYLAYQGRHHEMIQREMRELGHVTWNRRALYGTTRNGKFIPGWPKRYGWIKEALRDAQCAPNAQCRVQNAQRRTIPCPFRLQLESVVGSRLSVAS